MPIPRCSVMAMMLLLPSAQDRPNPWVAKVAPAVERAAQSGTVEAYREALDAAWHADDWQTGLDLARQAVSKHANVSELHGPLARAFWRAGLLAEAERIADKLSLRDTDRIGLEMLIVTQLPRGDKQRASEAANRLIKLPALTAEDLAHVVAARTAEGRLVGMGELIRRIQKLCDPDRGYPENLLGEQLEGLAEFHDAVGSDPVNQITSYGSVDMPALPVFNLPACEAFIDGRGPFRLIVDTGGSIGLSIDQQIAEDIGLRSLSSGSIHGVGGKEQSGQALAREVRIGGIACRRALTRIFNVRESLMNAADGILGTGLFGDARMTLDFQTGRLVLAPSSDDRGEGTAADVRIVGDAKLILLLPLQGEPAAALLDTGADALAMSPSRIKRSFPGRHIQPMPALALGVGSSRRPEISLTPALDFELAGRKYLNSGGLSLNVLDTLLSPLMGVQCDLLIGMPVMRHMRSLTVDFPRCKMWIHWLSE